MYPALDFLPVVFYGTFGVMGVIEALRSSSVFFAVHSSTQVLLRLAFFTLAAGVCLNARRGRAFNLIMAILFVLYGAVSLGAILTVAPAGALKGSVLFISYKAVFLLFFADLLVYVSRMSGPPTADRPDAMRPT